MKGLSEAETIASNVFGHLSLREFISFCRADGWRNNDMRGLARLYRKVYPRNCLFVVKYRRCTVGNPFATYAAARRWVIWNYKGNVSNCRIVAFDPALASRLKED